MIGIVGYGVGNVRSVLNAFRRLDIEATIVEQPDALAECDRILLPGVGAFEPAMRRLNETGFREALDEAALKCKTPVLGICLGMQLLADVSLEFGEHRGLGYVPGTIRQIPVPEGLRLPHMGWNDLDIVRDCPLAAELSGDTSCYFVHSFAFEASDEADVVATAEYGAPVTAMIARDNIFGTQFHPEKSQDNGDRILSAFAAL